MALTFKKLADTVAEDIWGFVPSRQIKPVHFANGFVRALCGKQGSVDLLLKAAGAFRKGNARVSTEQFLADIDGRYESRTGDLPVDAAKDLRSALDLVLNQDRALFRSENFASLTLTHHEHVTPDNSDQRTGRFMAEVLASADDGRIVETLRDALDLQTDNVYLLSAPLLDVNPLGPTPARSAEMVARIAGSPVLGCIQDAFTTLVKYQPSLEKTMFLQRAVELGSFAIFLHLVNAPMEPEQRRAELMPLLMTSPGPAAEIREASRATFIRARQRIEQAFEEGLGAQLRSRGEHEMSDREYRALARSWLPDLDAGTANAKKEQRIWDRFQRDFDAFLIGTPEPFDAFKRAAVRAAFLVMGEEPESVSRSLGRMVGLVYPRHQGRGDKYFSPAPQFLDMLVLCLIEPSEGMIPVEDFWARARERFGLLSGSEGSADSRRLLQRGIRRASPTELEDNAKGLLTELTRMGHAREYADDIAMVSAGGQHG